MEYHIVLSPFTEYGSKVEIDRTSDSRMLYIIKRSNIKCRFIICRILFVCGNLKIGFLRTYSATKAYLSVGNVYGSMKILCVQTPLNRKQTYFVNPKSLPGAKNHVIVVFRMACFCIKHQTVSRDTCERLLALRHDMHVL